MLKTLVSVLASIRELNVQRKARFVPSLAEASLSGEKRVLARSGGRVKYVYRVEPPARTYQ
jgi:hypothetical protein